MDVPVAWGSQSAAVLDIGALRFMELRFPSALVLPAHAHDRPTLAVVMKGSFETRLAADVELCGRSSLRIEPAGSQHTNHFGPLGAHIVVVQPDPTSPLLGPAAERSIAPSTAATSARVSSVARSRASSVTATPYRRSRSRASGSSSSPRSRVHRVSPRGAPPWVAQATELIHDRFLEALRIETIADGVGVRPSELVRAFRAFHGVPVGTYARQAPPRVGRSQARGVGRSDRLARDRGRLRGSAASHARVPRVQRTHARALVARRIERVDLRAEQRPHFG